MKISKGVKLIVGLGNPGGKYKFTRHNLGKLLVSRWQKKLGFAGFRLNKKMGARLSEGKFGRQKLTLALSETFMNNSGKSVRQLAKRYTLNPKNLIVVHDDIDLPLGRIRIGKGRGPAGHKGVQSIIDELGTKNFIRFRIGIKPKSNTFASKNLDKFVLKEFTKKEKEVIKKSVTYCMKAIEMALKEGLEKAMNEFNK